MNRRAALGALSALAAGCAEERTVDEAVRKAYFAVDDALFGLQACREEELLHGADAGRAAFEAVRQQIAVRFGAEALAKLDDTSKARFLILMVRQCAGRAGLEELNRSLTHLSATIAG